MIWKRENIKDLTELFTDGDWIETKNQSVDGIRLIQTGNIGFGKFKPKEDKKRFISLNTFEKLKCKEIYPGDILTSRLPDPVGKSCIIPDVGERMITGVDCSIIRLKPHVDKVFFAYYQMSNEYLNEVNARVTGTTRSRISRKNLGQIKVPIPPLPEQKQIVETLDKAFEKIDKAIANTEQNLQNVKELFESYLESVFENKGDDWEEKRFDEVCVLQRGFDLPTRLRKKGKYPLVSSNGITDYVDLWKVKSPGVSTGRSGTIGKIHYIEKDYFPLNTSLYIKEFHGNDERCVYYFLQQFDLSRFQSGAGVPTLNRNNVHPVKVYFPISKEEQKQITSKLDALTVESKKIEAIYSQKIADLEELKKSILEKAFKGELTSAA